MKEEEDLDVVNELEEAVCADCKGTFLLEADEDPEKCPLCNTVFDGAGD